MKKEFNGLPKMAAYLGYGGLLPFLGFAIAILLGYSSIDIMVLLVETGFVKNIDFNHQPKLVMALQAGLSIYAAIIISFLGAIHWGVVIALNERLTVREKNSLLIYSIVPALLAWLSFILSMKITLFALAFIVLMTYFLDSLLLFKKLELEVSAELSKGFAKLRLHLSFTVSFILFLVAVNS